MIQGGSLKLAVIKQKQRVLFCCEGFNAHSWSCGA